MSKNYIIIKNRLTKFIPVFEEIKKNSLFTTHIINYNEFLSDEYKQYLKSYNQSEIIIAIKSDFYSRVKEEFILYLKSIFLPGFNNIIYLATKLNLFNNDEITSGTRHSFFLYEEADLKGLTINLMLYTIKVFSEATLSIRLLDYITNSFEGIVNEELLKKRKKEI